jgi:hypothetical protein
MDKIKYSNQNIVPFDIWFLENTKDFSERKLLIGRTAKNYKTVVSLVEKRIADEKVFVDTQAGEKAEKIIHNEKGRILYTRQDVICSKKGKPFGWTFGDNREFKNKKGEIVEIKQFRSDSYGNSELVKHIKLS